MKVWLWVALAMGAIGTAVAFWDQAFPQAALDFRLSRAQVIDRMEQWLASQKVSTKDYHRAVVFEEEDDTRNYIELQAGLPELNRLVQQGVSVWYWEGRWFRPEQKEEFTVSLNPRGELVAYTHTVDETRAAPGIARSAARALAEKFLREHARHHPFKRLRLIEQNTEQKPHRIDYTFTWEQDDLRVKNAPYRLTVRICGNEVGAYSETLKIPEDWSRWFARRQELNKLCSLIANCFFGPLAIGGFILFVIYVRRGQLSWTRAIPRGWLLLLGVAALGNIINSIPTEIANYETTKPWSTFVMDFTSAAVRNVLATMVGTWLLALVADPLYRERLVGHLPFREALGPSGLRYPETLRGIALGVVFACVNFGYVCLFYVVSRHFGAWAPLEVDYSKGMSGWLPWMESFHTGLSAAFIEELLFRVLSILLYWKVFRSRWLAVVLSAATWALLHSDYPQMPGYIRGIELTVVGSLWGAVMLRYGIVTTLVAHYLYNCWLGSMVVIRSPSLVDQAGSVVVSLWPIALGLWGAWRYARRGLTADRPAAAPEAPDGPGGDSLTRWWDLPASTWNLAPQPLPCWRRRIILAFSIAILVAAQTLPLRQDLARYLGKLDWSKERIVTRADDLLLQHEEDPADFQRHVSLEGDPLKGEELKYLVRNTDWETANHLRRQEWPGVRWNIRYFRFGEKEEFRFTLDARGRLLAWNHVIPRESEGASLEKDEALALARESLEENHGIDLDREQLVQDDLDQQERRRDYTFSFERRDWRVGESRLRTRVTVQGDEVVGFERRLKTPEAWQRQEAATGWREGLAQLLGQWLGIALLAFFGLLFVVMIIKNLLPWKIGFLLAIIPTTLLILDRFNRLPDFYAEYTTTTPHLLFLAEQAGYLTGRIGWEYLKSVFVACLALGLMRWAFGWSMENLALWPRRLEERQRLWQDALTLGLAGVAIWQGRNWLDAFATGWFLPEKAASYSLPKVTPSLPWLGYLLPILHESYNAVFRMAIKVAGAVIFYRRFPKLTWAFLVFCPVLSALEQKTCGEIALHAVTLELQWLLFFVVVWRIWRFNALAAFLGYAMYQLLPSIKQLAAQGGPAYTGQAIPLVAALLIPILIAWLPSSRPES
jgi:hypothetical protein